MMVLINALISALIIKVSWAFSIAELFPSVGSISLFQSLALAFLSSALFGKIQFTNNKDTK